MAHRKPKRPKRPKRSASLATWERYDQRVRDWEQRCRQIVSDKKRKEQLMKKHKC